MRAHSLVNVCLDRNKLFLSYYVLHVISHLQWSSLVFWWLWGSREKLVWPKSCWISHLSQYMPSQNILLASPWFPSLTTVFNLSCSFCTSAPFVSSQCWLGGQRDDGCIWGLRGHWCRICLTYTSKGSAYPSSSSNGALGSWRHWGRWCIEVVCEKETVTERHWQVFLSMVLRKAERHCR